MRCLGFLIFLCSLPLIWSEDFDWGIEPKGESEYKIYLEAGMEDCYFQQVEVEAGLYINFQVLKGGDGMAGFSMKGPNGTVLYPYEWKQEAVFDENNVSAGVYEICVDNRFSKFASKLVYLYISTFSMENWQKFSDAIGRDYELAEEKAQHLTSSLSNVEYLIRAMGKYQQYFRKYEARDWAMLQSNLSYVVTWSLVQVVVIILVSLSQIYLIRKFFDSPKVWQRAR